MHQYIRKILYKDLTKLTVEKVLKQLRKLNWDDDEIKEYVIKCISSIWNVRFNGIHCIASVLAGLTTYHVRSSIIFYLNFPKFILYRRM